MGLAAGPDADAARLSRGFPAIPGFDAKPRPDAAPVFHAFQRGDAPFIPDNLAPDIDQLSGQAGTAFRCRAPSRFPAGA